MLVSQPISQDGISTWSCALTCGTVVKSSDTTNNSETKALFGNFNYSHPMFFSALLVRTRTTDLR